MKTLLLTTIASLSGLLHPLLPFLDQLVDDLHCTLELCHILFSRLYLAGPAPTSRGTTIIPSKVIALPCNACVHPVDIFASRRDFGWDRFEDPVQFVDKSRIVRIRFSQRDSLLTSFLKFWGSAWTQCRRNEDVCLGTGLGERVDRVRGRRCKATSYACPKRMRPG